MKRILCFSLSILFVLMSFAGCSKENQDASSDTGKADAASGTKDSESAAQNGSGASGTENKTDKIKVTMENGGSFIIELYPQYAPETCANFKSLVESHFYDGLTFHRVMDNFMAQGGSKDGIGVEGSDKTIKGEFASNGFTQNTLKHTRGVISMARRPDDPNSASSQFFICYGDETFLDGDYAAFGKVIEGMDVVDGFCKVERTYNGNELSKPVEPIIIKTMEVI